LILSLAEMVTFVSLILPYFCCLLLYYLRHEKN